MTVLDAQAVLAFLKDEPAATEVALLLDGGNARLTAVGVCEVLDRLMRIFGVDGDSATLDLAELPLQEPIPVDGVLGTRAGLLRARHYHRSQRAVSLADCVAAAAARILDEPLATADPHLLDLCHAEEIAVLPLPDSGGTRWSARLDAPT